MIQIKFKNLERSQLAVEIVNERFESLVEKFPKLNSSKITITLEMENSPLQAGPDHFQVKVHISNGVYSGITLAKSHSNLYLALADLVDHMLEVLNRFTDKKRVLRISKTRKALNFLS